MFGCMLLGEARKAANICKEHRYRADIPTQFEVSFGVSQDDIRHIFRQETIQHLPQQPVAGFNLVVQALNT